MIDLMHVHFGKEGPACLDPFLPIFGPLVEAALLECEVGEPCAFMHDLIVMQTCF